MFKFYQNATICYAFLEDVNSKDDPKPVLSSFSKSRWFKRGWTLQELLAPSIVVFYASDWTSIGTRDTLSEAVARTTKIHHEYFTHRKFSDYSIAQKFSWASGRQTTRIEDEAYCLLGLFSVSMPLLYGEGRRAFTRLQEELMKISDDHTIFAWSTLIDIEDGSEVLQNSYPSSENGILAPYPAAFAGSGHIIKCEPSGTSLPFSVTNMGLSINLPLIDPESRYTIPYIPSRAGYMHNFSAVSNTTFALTPTGTLAALNCCSKTNKSSRMAIVIDKIAGSTRYERTSHSLGLIALPLVDIQKYGKQCGVLIKAHNEELDSFTKTPGKLIIVRNMPSPEKGFQPRKTRTAVKCHTQSSGIISFRMPNSEQATLTFEDKEERSFTISVTIGGVYDRNTLTAVITAHHGLILGRRFHGSQGDQKDELPLLVLPPMQKVEKLPHAFRITFPMWSYFNEELKTQHSRSMPKSSREQSVSLQLWG